MRLIYTTAGLHEIIGMIEQIEGLGLQRDAVPLSEMESSGNSKIYFIDPWTVERIEVEIGTGAESVDTQSGVARGLIKRAVVEVKTAPAAAGIEISAGTSGIQKSGVRPAGIELHHRRDRPIRENAIGGSTG